MTIITDELVEKAAQVLDRETMNPIHSNCTYCEENRQHTLAKARKIIEAVLPDIIDTCAQVAGNYKRDASFDDSMVGALEHNSNQANIASAIRSLSPPPGESAETKG